MTDFRFDREKYWRYSMVGEIISHFIAHASSPGRPVGVRKVHFRFFLLLSIM